MGVTQSAGLIQALGRLRTHFNAVVRGKLDNRSSTFVEAMNGLMQHAKRAGRGFRTASQFINIAYLRLS